MASLVWDTPNIQHPDRLFPFIPGTYFSLSFVLVKLAFYFSRVLFCSPNIPSIPPQPTKGIDFGKHEIYPLPFFSLFLFPSCANLFTACISSCTHCLLQVSASCGATARRGFESPFCCMHAAYAGKEGRTMKMEAISSTLQLNTEYYIQYVRSTAALREEIFWLRLLASFHCATLCARMHACLVLTWFLVSHFFFFFLSFLTFCLP